MTTSRARGPHGRFGPAEREQCERLIAWGLAEDLGDAGDLTTEALVAADASGQAAIVSRSSGVLAGLPAAEAVFRTLDSPVQWERRSQDGDQLAEGTVLATVRGPIRSLLSGERLALNFLTHLSGIATLTRRYVEAAGPDCAVYDTRKTLPAWRVLEKYAVRTAGGHNHRMGLFDAVLIKDNHLAHWHAVGGPKRTIADAVRRARESVPSAAFIEIELDRLDQLDEALAGAPDAVLLDNMPPETLREAVAIRDSIAPRVLLEASGGITLETVARVAATGVDRISVGALTQSAPALDIGMDWR